VIHPPRIVGIQVQEFGGLRACRGRQVLPGDGGHRHVAKIIPRLDLRHPGGTQTQQGQQAERPRTKVVQTTRTSVMDSVAGQVLRRQVMLLVLPKPDQESP
jgi:hypothetical protein